MSWIIYIHGRILYGMRGLKECDTSPSYIVQVVASPAERMDKRASQKSVLRIAKCRISTRDAWIKGVTLTSRLSKSICRISWGCVDSC